MMIQNLTEIASLSDKAAAQGERFLRMIDEWETSEQARYERMNAALDSALEVLRQISETKQ